jgi:hypothetical protein
MRTEEIYQRAKEMIVEDAEFLNIVSGDDVFEELRKPDAKRQAWLAAGALVMSHLSVNSELLDWQTFIIRYASLAFAIIRTQLERAGKYGDDAYMMSERQRVAVERTIHKSRGLADRMAARDVMWDWQ